MKNMRRCPACGRRHKYSHEWRVGTDWAYSPKCKTDEQLQKERKKAKEDQK